MSGNRKSQIDGRLYAGLKKSKSRFARYYTKTKWAVFYRERNSLCSRFSYAKKSDHGSVR